MNEQNIPQEKEVVQSSNNISSIIIIVLTALVVGAGVYIWQNSKLQNLQQEINSLENQIKLIQQLEDQDNNLESSVENNNLNEISNTSSLDSIDSIWNLYTNNEYGFSIKVPKKVFHNYGSMCDWQTDSYRPKGGIVPVKIFEEDNKIYVSSEYFYALSGETIEDGKHYYSECNRITNSLSHLKNKEYFQQLSWEFIVSDANNDIDLENFIKERYGNGCKLGNKNPSAQEGVFDILIQGDGKDLSETECPLNYATVLKYHPEKNLVISWDLGQAYTFFIDESYESYDQEMVDSFRFE
jgi:cell division protein FtsL